MHGLGEKKTFAARKLQFSEGQMREVVTAIVTRFVQLQSQNNMLVIEALFRYPSREVKDSILHCYGADNQQKPAQPDVGFGAPQYDRAQLAEQGKESDEEDKDGSDSEKEQERKESAREEKNKLKWTKE